MRRNRFPKKTTYHEDLLRVVECKVGLTKIRRIPALLQKHKPKEVEPFRFFVQVCLDIDVDINDIETMAKFANKNPEDHYSKEWLEMVSEFEGAFVEFEL